MALPKIPQKKGVELREESLSLLEADYSQTEMRRRFNRIVQILHKELILENAGNYFLRNYSKKTISLIRVTRHLNARLEAALEEHLRILKAINRQNIEEGKEWLKKHLRNVKSEIIRNYEAISEDENYSRLSASNSWI